eukprot:6181382-Pleurochrysis_carterae.AAC.1
MDPTRFEKFYEACAPGEVSYGPPNEKHCVPETPEEQEKYVCGFACLARQYGAPSNMDQHCRKTNKEGGIETCSSACAAWSNTTPIDAGSQMTTSIP